MNAERALLAVNGRASLWTPDLVPALASVAGRSSRSGLSSRLVMLVGGDVAMCSRLRTRLGELRWEVHEVSGGAAAMARLEELRPEALLVDSWLPDLDVGEFLACVQTLSPGSELLGMDGSPLRAEPASPRRNELLQVLREVSPDAALGVPAGVSEGVSSSTLRVSPAVPRRGLEVVGGPAGAALKGTSRRGEFLPEMVGTSEGMQELAKLVRLVAPRSTTVLIEGETGTGKELVAKALHRLSTRANKPFLVLNCAAIPEALLEAELFGHTRGAFTGAVRSRTGRIEAADGGTLFLDEIGEMPLALQAKMLRFLECGELQRVGENEPSYVDVRVIAATHQPLERRAEEQSFRLDLYHRLAVFPIEVPTLRSRMDDLALLAEHFLSMHARGSGVQGISPAAMERLRSHHWPGNVRELMHVLERALILAGTNPVIEAEDVRVRQRDRSPSA